MDSDHESVDDIEISTQDNDGPPAKRRRLSNTAAAKVTVAPVVSTREFDVGIRAFVNPNTLSFIGTLKTRYTDFLVNEILPDGTVVHLKSTKAPKSANSNGAELSVTQAVREAEAPQSVPAEDNNGLADQSVPTGHAAEPESADVEDVESSESSIPEDKQRQLAEYLNETAATEILALHESIKSKPQSKTSDHPTVRTEFTSDRSIRSQVHQFIRETFRSRIDSSTDHDGVLILKAAPPKPRGGKQQRDARNNRKNPNARPGKLGWLDRGGEYVHFTLYKENKDTMEAISWLSKQLKCNAKIFQFAGTKDRRAVTSQRCSAYRIDADRLAAQNYTLRGSKIGDFQHQLQGLELGDLGGNEFVITLRDCRLASSEVIQPDLVSLRTEMKTRMNSLRQNGYLNYYGEQRFGTFSVRTDVIGRYILKDNYEAACDAILSFQHDALDAAENPDTTTTIGQDDKNRALAIHKWQQGGSMHDTFEILPRKFSAETQVMRHLSKNSNDFLGALLGIQRNLRLMYVHAYQSLVWNLAATNRMKLYGSQVVAGDLVLVKEHKGKKNQTTSTTGKGTNVDADGEVILEPGMDDRATQEDDVFERARALTDEEAKSGEYTIFDLVLPLPGYDILYPGNESGEFFSTFMKSEDGGKLDPYNMRRKHRDFSLSGGYRKMLARIGEEYSAEVHQYEKDDEQFVKTDMELLNEVKQAERQGIETVEEDVRRDTTMSGVEKEETGSKLAVVLKFQLGSSQYATMALRELSRGGILQYKPDFSGGR